MLSQVLQKMRRANSPILKTSGLTLLPPIGSKGCVKRQFVVGAQSLLSQEMQRSGTPLFSNRRHKDVDLDGRGVEVVTNQEE